MKKLVTLWRRPLREEGRFMYSLIYYDEDGRRRQKSLGHADARKAERQRAKLEQDLRMGLTQPDSMRLNNFLEDWLVRSRGQVRENTLVEYEAAMKQFIRAIGNIDFHQVKYEHGEVFLRFCLDKGNSPATVMKKLRGIKRIFEVAVERRQLNDNPIRRIRGPKVPKKKVHTFSREECEKLISTAQVDKIGHPFRWDLFMLTSLCTGMRRGELLNTIWTDIDFNKKLICVSPKKDTSDTWEWNIKDTDRRILPLTDELVHLLEGYQKQRTDKSPYVFIVPARYDHIQKLRKQGKWSVRKGAYPMVNFDRQFRLILKHAKINQGEFHDFRRTCLSNWFIQGLREYDVMKMAGHSSFETTKSFYLAVHDDLLEKTRQASEVALKSISVAKLLHCPSEENKEVSLKS